MALASRSRGAFSSLAREHRVLWAGGDRVPRGWRGTAHPQGPARSTPLSRGLRHSSSGDDERDRQFDLNYGRACDLLRSELPKVRAIGELPRGPNAHDAHSRYASACAVLSVQRRAADHLCLQVLERPLTPSIYSEDLVFDSPVIHLSSLRAYLLALAMLRGSTAVVFRYAPTRDLQGCSTESTPWCLAAWPGRRVHTMFFGDFVAGIAQSRSHESGRLSTVCSVCAVPSPRRLGAQTER